MARKKETAVTDAQVEAVAEASAQCPVFVLRADNKDDFWALIHLAHNGRPELRTRVREFELWREENL